MGTFRLYVTKHDNQTEQQQLVFSSHHLRTKYIRDELRKTCFKGLQYTYKHGEYLRAYRGEITFIEYDVVSSKSKAQQRLTHKQKEQITIEQAKVNAEKFFTIKTKSPAKVSPDKALRLQVA